MTSLGGFCSSKNYGHKPKTCWLNQVPKYTLFGKGLL